MPDLAKVDYYAPADQPCFEAFRGRPFAHGDQYFELDAQFPLADAAAPP